MVINLDSLSYFLDFVLNSPPTEVYLFLLKNGGWVILCVICYKLFLPMYHLNRIGTYMAKWKWVFLAVDIPKGNEQTPKAVEQIFAHLLGAHKSPDLEEAYLDGFRQRFFSFEIVSIEGYIQFIIGTEKKFRDLVEASIYAQYPDAEITEIEDYAKDFPEYFPNKDYQLWGTEYLLINKKQCYPIRTYEKFEHSTAEEVFKDPMAALLETLSRLGKGEFGGIQIIAKPINKSFNNWVDDGLKLVKKLIGAKVKIKETLVSKLGGLPGQALDLTADTLLGREAAAVKKFEKEEMPSLMLHLSPGEKEIVEEVERKISKLGFACKIRVIYLAKKDVYDKNRFAYGVTGAFKQYTLENLNGIKPDGSKVITHVHFFMKEPRLNWRRTRLINAYKARSRWKGIMEYILNIEELASLWHFPMLTVKAPLVAKTEARRAQPPVTLPVERTMSEIRPVERKGHPPVNLPI